MMRPRTVLLLWLVIVIILAAAVVASAGGADQAQGPSDTNTFGQPIVWTNGLAAESGQPVGIKLVTDDPLSRSLAISRLEGFTNLLIEEWPGETNTNATQPSSVTAPAAAVKRPAVRASNFGFGGALPIPNEVTQVNMNFDKGFDFRVAHWRVGLHEIRLSFTNGVVKRTSLLFAGRTSFRAPLSVEGVEVSGALLIFAFVSAAALLWLGFSRKHFEPAAPTNGGQGAASDGSGVAERPP